MMLHRNAMLARYNYFEHYLCRVSHNYTYRVVTGCAERRLPRRVCEEPALLPASAGEDQCPHAHKYTVPERHEHWKEQQEQERAADGF